jgi:hypothetical protein
MMRDNTDDFATTISNRYGGYHVTSNGNYNRKEEKDERTEWGNIYGNGT